MDSSWPIRGSLRRISAMSSARCVASRRRRLAAGTARILSATVSRTAQRWFVSFTVAVDRAAPASHARPGAAVGVDLGVRALLAGVDDQGRVLAVAGP